jgi:hypothetical protein
MTKDFALFLKNQIESSAASINSIAAYYNVDGANLRYQYKEYISDFRQWKEKHYHPYVLYKSNLGPCLSIDETCLSQGELYTIVTRTPMESEVL